MSDKSLKGLERWKHGILERKAEIEKELNAITGINTPENKTSEWYEEVKRLKRRLKRQKSSLSKCENAINRSMESKHEFSFISDDILICEYVEEMSVWIQFATLLSSKEVKSLFYKDKDRVIELFGQDPSTILSQDPSHWAEMLAVSWGIMADRPLEFV